MTWLWLYNAMLRRRPWLPKVTPHRSWSDGFGNLNPKPNPMWVVEWYLLICILLNVLHFVSAFFDDDGSLIVATFNLIAIIALIVVMRSTSKILIQRERINIIIARALRPINFQLHQAHPERKNVDGTGT